MYLFKLNKVVLFCIFILPILLFSDKNHLSVIPTFLFLLFIISLISLGNSLMKKGPTVNISKLRFNVIGSLLIIVSILSGISTFMSLQNNIGKGYILISGLIFMSIISLFLLIDFGLSFSIILYNHRDTKPTLRDKILIIIMIALFPIGVFYIKKKLFQQTAQQLDEGRE